MFDHLKKSYESKWFITDAEKTIISKFIELRETDILQPYMIYHPGYFCALLNVSLSELLLAFQWCMSKYADELVEMKLIHNKTCSIVDIAEAHKILDGKHPTLSSHDVELRYILGRDLV